MKKLLILGATGGTGRNVFAKAAAKGYEVTALTRHPDNLPLGIVGARVLTGNVLDGEAVMRAMEGQDAVVSSLGVGNSLKSGGLIEKSVPIVLRAMERAGTKRLVFTSAYGVGETYRDVPMIPRLMIAVLLRDLYADKKAGEDILTQSPLDWTLVYPSTLSNKPAAGRYRVGERLSMSGLPTIARADVADFLVTQIEDRRFVRRGVLISS